MNKEEFEEAKKKHWAALSPFREMLNSQLGQQLLTYLKNQALNPPGGIYAPGSFDKTAFNLGRLSFVADLDDLARGPIDERRDS